MKIVSTYDAVCKQISAHEPNYCINGDESPRGSTRHVHDHIFDLEKRQNKINK